MSAAVIILLLLLVIGVIAAIVAAAILGGTASEAPRGDRKGREDESPREHQEGLREE